MECPQCGTQREFIGSWVKCPKCETLWPIDELEEIEREDRFSIADWLDKTQIE